MIFGKRGRITSLDNLDPKFKEWFKSSDRARIMCELESKKEAGLKNLISNLKYLPLGTLFFCTERSSYKADEPPEDYVLIFEKVDHDGNCSCHAIWLEDMLTGNFQNLGKLVEATATVDLEAPVITYDHYQKLF